MAKKHFIRYNPVSDRVEAFSGKRPKGSSWQELTIDKCCPKVDLNAGCPDCSDADTITLTQGNVAYNGINLFGYDSDPDVLTPGVQDNAQVSTVVKQLRSANYYYTYDSQTGTVLPDSWDIVFKLAGVEVDRLVAQTAPAGLIVAADIPASYDEIEFIGNVA